MGKTVWTSDSKGFTNTDYVLHSGDSAYISPVVSGDKYPIVAHKVTKATVTITGCRCYWLGSMYVRLLGRAAGVLIGQPGFSSGPRQGGNWTFEVEKGDYGPNGGYNWSGGRMSLEVLHGMQWNVAFLTLSSSSTMTLEVEWELYTSPAGAPTAVTLSSTLGEANDSVQLKISGAAAGNGNAIKGYQIDYRDSATTSFTSGWSHYKTHLVNATSCTVNVSPPTNRGYYRQFRVKTLGTAAGYDSGYKEGTGFLRRNSAPTAPTAFTASPAIYESGMVALNWSGAGDTDNNISKYELHYGIAPQSGGGWGSWIYDRDVTGTSINVNFPSNGRGDLVKWMVRAVDAFSVASDWKQSNIISKNKLPVTPQVLFPQNEKATFNTQPYVRIKISAEPDGQSQTLYSQMGAGGAVSHGEKGAGEHLIRLNSLTLGANTVKFWMQDSLGAQSDMAAITLTLKEASMPRKIDSNALLFDTAGGFNAQQDLQALLTQINQMLDYYNEPSLAFSLSTKHFHTWFDNIKLLRSGIDKIHQKTGEKIAWVVPGTNAPRAGVINQLIDVLPLL